MTESAAPPPEPEPLTAFERKLQTARRELLETSVRSRLLHTPLGSARAKIVEVSGHSSEAAFRVLVRDGRSMSFRAAKNDNEQPDQEMLALAQPEDEDERAASETAPTYSETKLQTNLSSTKLQTRLRSIAYDAQSFESEQGVNILYLALGFLKWYEAHDQATPRYAPLLLIPVSLTRASARERFKLTYSGEELATNLSLQERLNDEGIELPIVPDADDLSPDAYAAAVSVAVVGLPSWEVQPDTIVLGFFSFAKLMMYRDLDPDNWPLTWTLRDHAIVNGLLGDGFRGDGNVLTPEDTAVDTVIDISTVGHVVDADSSQMLAIEDVRAGSNLVIQGPPGTGKSQTITNLIASAVRDGKRVLFVAEKMAALNVVRSNLDRIGLAQTCLELHSHKAKKRAVLLDLEETYQLHAAGFKDGTSLASDLRQARDALNAHVERIHAPLEPSSITPYEVFGKLAKLEGHGVAAPEFHLAAAQGWTRHDLEERGGRVTQLAHLVGSMGMPAAHVWRGVGVDAMLPQDIERLARRARQLSEAIAEIGLLSQSLGAVAGVNSSSLRDAQSLVPFGQFIAAAPKLDARTIGNACWTEQRAEITALLETGQRFAHSQRRLENVLIAAAWDTDVSNIIREFSARGQSWFRWARAEYRGEVRRFKELSSRPPSKILSERLGTLHIVMTGQRARREIHDLASLGSAAFGSKWDGENSSWEALQAIDAWARSSQGFSLPTEWRERLGQIDDLTGFASSVAGLAARLRKIADDLHSFFNQLAFDLPSRFGVDSFLDVEFDSLTECLAAFAEHGAQFHEWCSWRIWSRAARESGLGEIVDRLFDGRLAAPSAPDVFQYVCSEALARQAFSERRELAVFDGRSHERILEDFRQLDREIIVLARREIQSKHVEQMPRGSRHVGEVGVLAREFEKQRRHLPLRQLIKRAGRAMQLIKPVWMMSPMSLAQFVEPGTVLFDLVVMDEASQVRPVEALGAIARAKQVVVVGDDKQLPPTSFFDRVAVDDSEPTDDDEFRTADVESILGLCTAQGIPDRMLRWHYRSQHESLIAVSNVEFYKKLFIVPSAESDDLGLRFRKVNGVYDRGKSRANRIEARAVAQAVIAHARSYRSAERFPKGMSLGVGTFSVAQRDAILDELEVLWRENADLAAFFGGETAEPFFVKNLESIQGDERDVVLISVGYGPDSDGFMAMSFGPLSSEGGERRLNVLISRARRRCEVFSSISAADIDLARAGGAGVRVLKTFLQYAENGFLDRPQATGRPIDSDFEEDVGNTLARLGYDVQHQVGVAGFFVDMAIKDPDRPGRYLIGIECDGAAYHSSRSARDRDRLREQVLIERGWRIHRIWSTDWFKRRDAEVTRVIAAVEAARAVPPGSRSLVVEPDVATDRPVANSADDASLSQHAAIDAKPSNPYIEAVFLESVSVEPHLLPRSKFIPILQRIIQTEGPIHAEEVGRRFAAVCGKNRAGSRIQQAVQRALKFSVDAGWLCADGPFYALAPIADCAPRDRSACSSATLRKPEMLPPAEIRIGLRNVVADHVGVDPIAAVVEVARMFGFQRTGGELQGVIEQQLRAMLGDGVLLLRNENRLYLAE